MENFSENVPTCIILSKELVQNIFLRITTSNISQKKSKQQLIAEHKRLENYKINGYQEVHNIRRQSESTSNLQLLLRISIVDLRVDNVSTGRFLLCRVMAKWEKLNALITLVEDPEGNMERLALYNMVLSSNITKIDESFLLFTDEFLPIGTQIAIKDPSYKIVGDGNTIICSDNPKNVIVIDHVNKEFSDLKWSTDLKANKDTFKRSIDDFRRCGNDYFALNDYKTAIDEYSGGIKLDPQNVTLLNNRAVAYLELHQFDKALADVEIALKYEPGNMKAAYRKVKALCGLKRYQEALITIRDLHEKVKVNNNTSFKQCMKQLLKHVEMLVSENENGEYDYLRIINEFYEKAKTREDGKGWVHKEGPRLDHADFLNNDIEIRPVEGKGRGWIAKRNIPENTLLMVSKAFKIVFNINEDKYSHEELIIRVSQSLFAEPDLHQEVYQLCCGTDPETLKSHILKIASIIKHNSFTSHNNITNLGHNNGIFGSGLCILPSYFNHSCVDENIFKYFIGDLMFIRTLRPISKDEELVISYSLDLNDYEKRSRYFKSINIDCQCRLCKLDRSESQEIKLRRAQLLETYEKSIMPRLFSSNVSPSLIKEMEKIITELRSLRKEHPDLEFDSIKLIESLEIAYSKSSKPFDINILKEAYHFSKKVRWIPYSMSISLLIFLYYFKHKEIRELMKWYEISLKEHIEPIRGKFKNDETNWRKESMLLTDKLFLEKNPFAFSLAVAE